MLLLAVGSAAFLWIFFPKAQSLDRYGVESVARGGLGTLRMRVEAATKTGARPLATLSDAPLLWKSTFYRPPHAPTSAVIAATTSTAKDTGGWGYDSATGRVFIDCAHTDSKLIRWSEY